MADVFDTPDWRVKKRPEEIRKRTFWQDVGDNYKYVYKPGLDRVRAGSIWGFEEDENFEVTSDMLRDKPFQLQETLVGANSKEEFDYRLKSWYEMQTVRENLAINKSIGAGLFAGLFDPINLVPLPTVWGMGFVKGAARLGAGAGVLTAGQEIVRGHNDPHYQPIESVFAIGGSTIMSGALGGLIGGLTKKMGQHQFKAQYYDEGADKVEPKRTENVDNAETVKYDATSGQVDNPLLLTYDPQLKFDSRIGKVEPMPNPKKVEFDKNGQAVIPGLEETKIKITDDAKTRERKRNNNNKLYDGYNDGSTGKRIIISAQPRNRFDNIYGNIVTIKGSEIEMPYEELLKSLGVKNSYWDWLKTKEGKSWVRKPEEEAMPEGAFSYEKTMKITIFGGLVSRFKSVMNRQFAVKIAGDGNFSFKDAKLGKSSTGDGNVSGGTVSMNQGKWSLYELNNLVKFTRDSYQSMYTGVKETKPFLGMDVGYMSTSLKNWWANRKDKTVMTPKMFYDEVGKLIMNASRQERFGKLDHPIPQVKEVAEKFIETMRNVKKAGDEAKFFNTVNNLKSKSLRVHNQILEISNDIDKIEKALGIIWKEVPDPDDPTKKIWGRVIDAAYRKKMKEQPSDAVLLQQLAVADFFKARHLDTSRNIEKELLIRMLPTEKIAGKLEEVIYSINKKRDEASEKFKKILVTAKERLNTGKLTTKTDPESLAKAFKKVENTRNYVKGLIEEDIEILKAIIEESKIKPLENELKEYANFLFSRIGDPRHYAKNKQMETLLKNFSTFKYKDTALIVTPKQEKELNRLLEVMRGKISVEQLAYIESLKRGLVTTGKRQVKIKDKEAFYVHRDYLVPKILDKRVEFEQFLINEFKKKPTGVYKTLLIYKSKGAKYKGKVVTDEMVEEQITTQVKNTVNKIVRDAENQNIDNIHTTGANSFNRTRSIDLPNYYFLKEYNGIDDFIDTDINTIARSYLNRTGPNLEMARMFDGDRFGEHEMYRALEDVIYRHAKEIDKDPIKFSNAIMVDVSDKYELINAVLGRMGLGIDTGSRSNTLVQGLMQTSQITMMGLATVASLADPAKIVLANGLKRTFGVQIKEWMTNLEAIEKLRLSKKATLMTGEGFDPRLNTAGRRVADQSDIMTNQLNRGFGKFGDKIFRGIDKMASGFYNVNLLNQWTSFWKQKVGYIANDRLMKTAWTIANKKTYKGFDADKKILASYGLDENKLKRIHFLWKKYEGETAHKQGDTFYGNVDKWMEDDPNLARDYLSAIRKEQVNTIITPTDADKTYMHYGKLKFSHWDTSMKDRQHNVYRMPLQYMSWAFAANNKIVISSLQGRHKGVMSGIVAMFAMGMMSDYIRNPGWWSYKSDTERMIKAIEYSGLTAYLLDINNILEVMSDNEFGIRPLFGQKNAFTGAPEDIISEPFGPVGGMAADVYGLFKEEATLDRRASVIRRLLPYNNVAYTRWLFKGMEKRIVDFIE